MAKESIVMKELHEIRERNHEATKNMTAEERIKFIREKADKGRKILEELRKVKE